MKIRSLLFALLPMAVAAPVTAQEASDAPKQYEMQEVPGIQHIRVDPAAQSPGKQGGGLMEEAEYQWYSRHFTIPWDSDGDGEADRDSARLDLPMPMVFPNSGPEVRGYGQIFAPGMIYSMYGNLTNDSTNLLFNSFYYEQFKDAGSFTIDSIRFSWYKNPNAGTPLAGSTFYVFRSPGGIVDKTYFASTAATGFRRAGARFDRDDLPVAFEAYIEPEGIDTTLNGNLINQTRMIFDQPLTFAAGTFAMPMIINDEGEARPAGSIGGPNDVTDWQLMLASWDFRRYGVQAFGTNNDWKAMGLTVFRPNGEFSTDRDTIYSINRAIVYTIGGNRVPATQEMWFFIWGKVDLSAGVQYHFGRQATNQGLGAPTPNPATSATRLPFSLTEVSQVSIDLFDVNGNHLRQLVESRYVPGHYTIALPIDELANGTYIARMVAGNNVYSMMVNVAK
jgi:hypothetical protein